MVMLSSCDVKLTTLTALQCTVKLRPISDELRRTWPRELLTTTMSTADVGSVVTWRDVIVTSLVGVGRHGVGRCRVTEGRALEFVAGVYHWWRHHRWRHVADVDEGDVANCVWQHRQKTCHQHDGRPQWTNISVSVSVSVSVSCLLFCLCNLRPLHCCQSLVLAVTREQIKL